jgi:hypothetical protein
MWLRGGRLQDYYVFSAMTSRTTALLLLAVSAAAIDTDFPGFVHFKNWAGGMGAQSTVRDGSADTYLPKSTTSLVPRNIYKDLCAADPKCTAFNGEYFSNLDNADGTTNTTYDMFLGIKGAKNPAPAAFCTVEEGHGDYMHQKWLSCDNDFNYSPNAVDIADHHLVTYPAPPDAIHTACLQNSKCAGFRIKNDQSSGDLLQATLDVHGWFKLPASYGTPGT